MYMSVTIMPNITAIVQDGLQRSTFDNIPMMQHSSSYAAYYQKKVNRVIFNRKHVLTGKRLELLTRALIWLIQASL